MTRATFVACWQRRVNRLLAVYDAGWDELAATPSALWNHPAHARIESARRRLRALLELRDRITAREAAP